MWSTRTGLLRAYVSRVEKRHTVPAIATPPAPAPHSPRATRADSPSPPPRIAHEMVQV